MMQTPDGPIRLRFSPLDDFGMLDHRVFPTPDAAAYRSIQAGGRNGKGCELIVTLFRRPDTSEEKFAAAAEWITHDLEMARRVRIPARVAMSSDHA